MFSAYIIGRHPRFFRFRWIFYLGVMLPDLISRPIYILWPQWAGYTIAIHTPVFMLFFSLLFAEFFIASIRNSIRGMLLLGAGLHFFIDLLQKHVGSGYFWFFPFSWASFKVGLFWPEATLPWVPVWIAIVIVVELILRGRDYRRKEKWMVSE